MPNGRSWPKITIVTPAYKQAQFLEETMRSVLMQGYPNLEYIVIDDGSPDNTAEIIQKYECRLAYWTTQKNRGQAAAINNGFARSTGEIMGWLNSDDLLLPRALERTAKAHMRDPQVKVTCGFRQVIDTNSKVVRDCVIPLVDNAELPFCCFLWQETVLWKRRAWEQIGPLEDQWKVILDYEYWLRMTKHGYRFKLIPAFLGQFRLYAECKTSALADVCELEQQALRERYLGRRLASPEAFNETNLWLKFRAIRAVPPNWFHRPWLAGLLVSGISTSARMFRNTDVAVRHRSGYVLP